MYARRDSPAGLRALAALRSGASLKKAGRAAGVDHRIVLRFLREEYDELRAGGLSVANAQARVGLCSPRMPGWDEARLARGDDRLRHHRRPPAEQEAAFWACFDAGGTLLEAVAGVSFTRSTAYRCLQRRYGQLRDEGHTPRSAGRVLRLQAFQVTKWEGKRRVVQRAAEREQRAARLAASQDAAWHVAAALAPHGNTVASAARLAAFWKLVHDGVSLTDTCKMLAMHPKTARRTYRRGETAARPAPVGRYLLLHERLLLADLLRQQLTQAAIAARLGRSPSTVSRELSRHRDENGDYLPHQADRAAEKQRERPRASKLAADPRLRALVQRKLNCYWSPEQIAGWLLATHPWDPTRRVCSESIYRALLVPGAQVLHSRYTAKLRTGRKVRRPHYLTRAFRGGPVRNMTMIHDRPAQVEDRVEPGHWEGDLILGLASRSAMITLRERVTHYGLVINLPVDHTSPTVTAALVEAFAGMPTHLRRTLTWDQGSEMARHQDFAEASGLAVYFAERSSPWQRGANENFNGLVRQFFPKNTDLSRHKPQSVATVTALLNNRPRKSLAYRTPAACFRAAEHAA
jgi:IS30 family transposase